MSQLLTMFINVFSYSDGVQSNNPQLRDFDYARRLNDIPTSKTRSQQHVVNPSEIQSVLSLQRSLVTGASWTISSTVGVTSRWTWSGVNPVLRTERVGGALILGSTITVARQGVSNIVRLTFSVLPAAGIISGDEIYLGPGSALNSVNQGIFTVVGASGNSVDVISPDMTNEVAVAITNPTDIYAFSTGPVRVGDFVRVSDVAFNYGNRDEFQITKVTSRWFEIQNTNMVPEGPITADVVVYDQLYKVTYLETTQPVNLYFNGSISPIAVEPVTPGEGGLVGIYLCRGPVYSLRVENLGYNAANITTFFAT